MRHTYKIRRGQAGAQLRPTMVIALLGAAACTPPTREFYAGDGGSSDHTQGGNAAASNIGGKGTETTSFVGGFAGAITGIGGTAAPESGAAGRTSSSSAASGATGIAGTPTFGGTTGTAGAVGMGGTPGMGGTSAIGGMSANGGTPEMGGGRANGGASDVGGAGAASGGETASGGALAVGGTLGSGGMTGPGGTGGNPATGGATVIGGKALGQTCAVGAECSSLNCVDGVCCTESSCPECMNCGSTGQCTYPVVGQPDPSGRVCSGPRTCSTSGQCKTLPGNACTTDSDCIDAGFCTDGVCCRSRCGGVCETCDATGSCQRVLQREDDSCRTDPTGVRMCDAQGICSMPHLLKDVNPLSYTLNGITNTNPSYPRAFTQGPDRRVYFSATDGTTGEELWVTDGSPSGTMLVADLVPNTGNSSPRGLVNAGSNLFFSAYDPGGIARLYATNGTPVGTRLVKDLGNSAFGGNVLSARAMGNVIYFAGCPSASGCELWRSDGSDAGTVMVADIMNTTLSTTSTQTFGSFPSELTVMGGAVYFRAANNVVGLGSTNVVADYELWKSDGTLTNTVRVADIDPGVANGMPTSLTVLPGVGGPRLLFAASRGATNQELYFSDGTVGNVSMVDINPGLNGSSPGPFVVMGNRAYFAATDGNAGRELWSTDGTVGGTYLVKDIYPGTNPGNPGMLTAAGNFLYFQANDGTSTGSQLWRSDGTTNGTAKVFAGFTPAGAGLFEVAALGNRVFMCTAGNALQELWVTDGTTTGTYRSCPDRAQACGQPFAGNPSGMAVIGGRMYFNATTQFTSGSSLGAEPFVYP